MLTLIVLSFVIRCREFQPAGQAHDEFHIVGRCGPRIRHLNFIFDWPIEESAGWSDCTYFELRSNDFQLRPMFCSEGAVTYGTYDILHSSRLSGAENQIELAFLVGTQV